MLRPLNLSRKEITLLVLGLTILVISLVGLKFYKVDISQFFAAEPAAPAGFVYVQGNKLMLNGTEYFAKGMNLLPGFKYHSKYLSTGGSYGNLEVFDAFMYWYDFDPVKINEAMKYYHDTLGLNTVRVMTPSLRYLENHIRYHGWQPWFLDDGSINQIYLDRLVQIINIAKQNNLKVFLELFHNSHFIDWECRAPDNMWSDCPSIEYIRSSVTNAGDARFVEPGTIKEQKYLKYLQSLLPYLKDNDGLFAYELSSESLLDWPMNGYGIANRRDWYQDKVGSFIVRMVRQAKQLDPNHPITEGEVTAGELNWTSWWAWPSPEFGQLNDIHNLNGGQSYTLASELDFLTPHFYFAYDPARPRLSLVEIKNRTNKPVALGEFGYFLPNADPLASPVTNDQRLAMIRANVDLRNNPGLSGYFLWSPLNPVDLPTGKFSIININTPFGNRALKLDGPPERRITTGMQLDFSFSLFTYDASYPHNQKPLPEAVAYFGPIATLANVVATIESIESGSPERRSYVSSDASVSMPVRARSS